MKKIILKLAVITALGVCVACGSDDSSETTIDNGGVTGTTGNTGATGTTGNTNITKPKSIVKANFTTTEVNVRDTFFSYNLGDVVNNFWEAEIAVEGYNSDYTYEIKIKGDVLKEEYSVPLTFDRADDGSASISILKFVKEQFLAAVDTYKAFIVEKDSNTELEINIPEDSTQRPYVIVDADEDGFLYNLIFSEDLTTSSTPLMELDSVENNTYYLFFAGSWAFSNGLDFEFVIYDLDLSLKGKVLNPSRFVTSGSNVVGYSINSSDVNNIVSETGDYFVRLEGTSSTLPNRNSPYQKIKIIKNNNQLIAR